MAIKESGLLVPPTTEQLDTTKVKQKDGTPVHREAVGIVDPELRGHRANVITRGPHPRFHDPADFDHDLGVTDYQLEVLADLLRDVVTELKITNAHLAMASTSEIFEGDVE